MEKLQVINHPQFGKLSYIELNGIEYFAANECALMLGYKRPADAISTHCKGSVKRRLPTKGGQQDIKFIPESDLWRLIIRSKLPQAEAIEKWIMEEVLPTIRKTGTYTMPKKDKQLELYNYFDKKYNGEAVLSIADVEHFTGLSHYSILKALKTGVEFMDYYYLKRDSLQRFKIDNPQISKLVGEMYVITRSGFELICKWYGIKIDYPDAFLRDMFSKRKAIEPPKQNAVTPVSERQKRIKHIIEMLENLGSESSCKAEQDILPQINTKDYDVILLVHK